MFLSSRVREYLKVREHSKVGEYPCSYARGYQYSQLDNFSFSKI